MQIKLSRPIGRFVMALMALSVLPFGAFANPVEASTATEPGKRPRIGLVLSGGGAKGGAHVGVLKVLEELRVPVDCIAGTSMGALIGAGYASGQPAAELESFVNGIDWSQVVGGAGRRELQPIEQKRMAAAASTPMELGFQQGSIVTPGGLTNSSGIDNLLRTYVARSRMVADFDQLPIPFRAVATDMVSGKMVVMDHGDLATAMRASMAIAGAFSPVVQNGYVLSDGGMVRNIPVDVARDTCAEMVIVVDLVESPTPPEKLVQATQLLKRSMGVMIKANEAVSLASLTERDILISVPMGDITTSDFDRVPETIPLGEAAARVAADRLAVYSVPEAEYTAWRQGVTTHQGVEARVASVQFEGLERVNPEYLRTMTTIQPGDTVSIDAISADALQMSALEDLDSVSYRIEGDLNNATLTWLPEEVSIGRDVLRPSLGMYGDGGGDLKFLLGVQHVRHWLNERGGQWRNTFQLGSRTMLTTSLYQPFDVGQRYFVEPGLLASRSVEDVYIDGSNVATYRFDDLGGRIDLGSNLGRNAQLRFGYWNGQRRTNVQTGFEFLPESDFRDAGLAFSARYDSRDKAAFAKSGLVAAVEYQRSDDSLGADRNWDFVEAGLRKALPIRKNLVWISVAGGTDLGDNLPGDRAFSIGGPNTMPAYQYDELRVGSYWLVDASFLWHLKDLARVKNQAIYAGIGLQAGGFYDRVDLVADNEVYGVSAYLSGPTQIGTFKLGAAANSETWSVWLSLGRSVGNGSILDHGLFR